MAEYIEREALLKAFRLIAKNPDKRYEKGMQDTIDCLVPQVIADVPSADVPLVMRGKWEDYKCSICDERPDNYMSGNVWIKHFPSYCPNCGARMEQEG